MPTLADAIVRDLRDRGVRTLFGVPGGGSNLDLMAAAGRAGLPFVLTATETAAAIAALAQAEVTGGLGACLTTLGPGAASVVNGVACAFLDRAPVVVFTDTYPAATSAAFMHQRLDHRAIMAPITKTSAVLTPESALPTLAHAIDSALAGPPGPVHLDCPGNVLSSAAPDAGAAAERLRPRVGASEVALPDHFDGLLAQAARPLLLVGLGARRADDAAAIRGLCERRGVPAMVTYKAKGVVPDDHPWFGGVFTHAAIERPLIDESDLLIGVGLDPVELLPRAWNHHQPILYCGPWRMDGEHVPFAAQLVGAVPRAARHVEQVLPDSTWEAGDVRGHVDEQRRRVSVPAPGLTAQRVVEIAAARLSSAAGRVTVDAGAHMFPATMLWPVSAPTGMLISNGLSTMGFALPAAIGAALVDRERPVVALTGDGGLLMCAAELLTAAREGLRIVVIVFSDASLSLIEIKQQARRLPAAGVALGATDWAGLARSMGVTGLVAANDDELERAVERALACAGPSLIEAKIDRSNYGATLRAVRG
jgi:acetolactate synthase-1/2/3 large subunit